jgi:hypothetical protein
MGNPGENFSLHVRMGTMKTKGAQLQVRGLGQAKQSLKTSVDPGKPQMQEMVETVFTPPHPDSFEALLDEPFARAFDHTTTQRQPQRLVRGIVDVLAMPFQVGMHRTQGVPCRRRQPLHVEGIHQVGQDLLVHAVTQAVPCADKPPAGPGSPPI